MYGPRTLIDRIIVLVVVIVFIFLGFLFTGQKKSAAMDNLKIEAVARSLEADTALRQYEEAISTDGYEIPDVDFLTFPLIAGTGVFITSPFHNRLNPFETNSGPSLREKMHKGVDLTNVKQSLVVATVSGLVTEHYPPPNGYWNGDGPFGGKIVITDSNGYEHVFAHLSETYVSSVPGQNWIEVGEPIARMGKTGLTTGVHLHYEIKKTENGHTTWYDPVYYFNVRVADNGQVLFPEDAENLTNET